MGREKGRENLIDISTRPDHKEISRRGGIASYESKKRKKEFKQIAETLLELQTRKGQAANIDAIRNIQELKGKNLNVSEAIMTTVVQKALTGDLDAIRLLQSVTGQIPKAEVSVEHGIKNEGKLEGILKQLEARKKEAE